MPNYKDIQLQCHDGVFLFIYLVGDFTGVAPDQ